MTLDSIFENCMPIPFSGCWLWMGGCISSGYGAVYINGKQILVHKLALSFSNKNALLSEVDVCHKCDIPSCCNPDHLFIGTRSDNMQDAAKKGRTCKGTRNGMSKLSDEEVEQIIGQAKAGVPQWLIARRFKISQPHVSNLLNGNRRGKSAY